MLSQFSPAPKYSRPASSFLKAFMAGSVVSGFLITASLPSNAIVINMVHSFKVIYAS